MTSTPSTWPRACCASWPKRPARPISPRMSPSWSLRPAKPPGSRRMPSYTYANSQLSCGTVLLARLADQFGTPLYVYSADGIRANYQRLAAAFAPLHPLICYAVKANFNLSLLRLLREEGAGFDTGPGGDVYRAL